MLQAPNVSYNLEQYKMAQLSPIPPPPQSNDEGTKEQKNAPFWHHSNGGRGGPDVPFILSKIVVPVQYREYDIYLFNNINLYEPPL